MPNEILFIRVVLKTDRPQVYAEPVVVPIILYMWELPLQVILVLPISAEDLDWMQHQI